MISITEGAELKVTAEYYLSISKLDVTIGLCVFIVLANNESSSLLLVNNYYN